MAGKVAIIIISMKVITFGTCITLFILFSLGIMRQYQKKATFIKTSYRPQSKFMPPTFIICNRDAFKDPKRVPHTFQDYIDNTESIQVVPEVVSSYGKARLRSDYGKWQVRDLFTIFRGRCKSIRYTDLIEAPVESVTFTFNNTNNYVLLVVENGMEIFYHAEVWPFQMPTVHDINQGSIYGAVTLQAMTIIRDQEIAGCNGQGWDRFLNCAILHLQGAILKNQTCLPFWIHSMFTAKELAEYTWQQRCSKMDLRAAYQRLDSASRDFLGSTCKGG